MAKIKTRRHKALQRNSKRMQIHLISGFLGSGKTTAIQTVCKALQSENKKVGVITNDQGIMLVDTGYFESNSIPNRQVVNGCFCCNYNALDENIESLILTNDPDVIFAESVGSCTDIVATVMKPLLQFKKDIRVTVSTFADMRLLYMLYVEKKALFNEEVKYIYQKQLEEAEIIVVSKSDLATKEMIDSIHDFFQTEYPGKKIIYINGTDATSTAQWLSVVQKHTPVDLSSLTIDYDVYGAGEAMLAWFDEEFEINSNDGNAIEDSIALGNTIFKQLKNNNLPIGHLKLLINQQLKVSYTEVQAPSIPVTIPRATKVEIILNARVQTDPETLTKIVSDAMNDLQKEKNCSINITNCNAFIPGYPRPTHRITNTITV